MVDVRRANFELQKQTGLKEVDISRRTQNYELTSGMRDIGQARTEGIRGVVNNALQRGIFNSGIRKENEAKVNRESDEAGTDLQSQIGFALEHLSNRENFLNKNQLQPLGGSGGGGIAAALERLMEMLFDLAGGPGPARGEFFPDVEATSVPKSVLGVNRPRIDIGGGGAIE